MSIWTEQKSIGDAGERIIKQYMELKGNEVEDILLDTLQDYLSEARSSGEKEEN